MRSRPELGERLAMRSRNCRQLRGELRLVTRPVKVKAISGQARAEPCDERLLKPRCGKGLPVGKDLIRRTF
jgi:hypothetical protein